MLPESRVFSRPAEFEIASCTAPTHLLEHSLLCSYLISDGEWILDTTETSRKEQIIYPTRDDAVVTKAGHAVNG
jgi:hypothetical protein